MAEWAGTILSPPGSVVLLADLVNFLGPGHEFALRGGRVWYILGVGVGSDLEFRGIGLCTNAPGEIYKRVGWSLICFFVFVLIFR